MIFRIHTLMVLVMLLLLLKICGDSMIVVMDPAEGISIFITITITTTIITTTTAIITIITIVIISIATLVPPVNVPSLSRLHSSSSFSAPL
jgi:hypothetical protein